MTGAGRRRRPRRAAPAAVREYATALGWLRRRRDGASRLTEAQFQAGERLAADFRHAQLMPRTTANWTAAAPRTRTRRSAPGAGVEMSDRSVAARQRFYSALDAVGPELAGVLADVCCYGLGLQAAGRGAGWPRHAAGVVLDLALTRLAPLRLHRAGAPRPPAPLGRRRLPADNRGVALGRGQRLFKLNHERAAAQ